MAAALCIPVAFALTAAVVSRRSAAEDRSVAAGTRQAVMALYVCGEMVATERQSDRPADGPRPLRIRPGRTTVGQLAQAIGAVLDDDRLELPDGRTYHEDDGCDGAPATIRVARWDAPDDRDPETFSAGFDDILLTRPGQQVTVGFAGPKERLPPPARGRAAEPRPD